MISRGELGELLSSKAATRWRKKEEAALAMEFLRARQRGVEWCVCVCVWVGG